MGCCGTEEGSALHGIPPGLPHRALQVSLALCPASVHHSHPSGVRRPQQATFEPWDSGRAAYLLGDSVSLHVDGFDENTTVHTSEVDVRVP